MSSMKLPSSIYYSAAIIASLCYVVTAAVAQDANYFFVDTQGQYIGKDAAAPLFGQPSPPITYPSSDLETSDVPIHLRQTLPKYRFSSGSGRFTTKEPRLQNNPEFAFSFQPFGLSTTSPSLSTLTSPPPSQPASSSPSSKLPQRKPNNPEYARSKYTANTVQLGGGGRRGNFLNNLRTRTFAPNNNNNNNANKSDKSKSKPYYINSNGDVQLTTRTPFVPKFSSVGRDTIAKVSNLPFDAAQFDPIPTDPSVEHSSTATTTENVHFASLLEDPISNNRAANHADDDVQVIKSVTVPPDQFYTVAADPTEPTNKEDLTTDVDDYVTEDYDDEEAAEEDAEETPDEAENAVKPDVEEGNKEESSTDTVKAEQITETVDEEDTEHVTEEHVTGPESEDGTTRTENGHDDVEDTTLSNTEKEEEAAPVTDGEETTTEELPTTHQADTNKEEAPLTNDVIDQKVTYNNEIVDASNSTDTLPEGAVVSVVTTKSVVNNTMIVTATPSPSVTEQMYSPEDAEEGDDDDLTTESWIVIASVQTSRSVSGARYLPSSIVEQAERTKFLNEPGAAKKAQKEPTENLTSSTTIKPNTSTESLTDKLDRQQSDLSSDLLTGGFRDIPVLEEGVQEKADENGTMANETASSTETSSTSAPTPRSTTLTPVVIRKFSPNLRRTTSTTQRPRKLFDGAKKDNAAGLLPPGFINRSANRKPTTPTQPAFASGNLDEPQSDEPAKNITLDDLKGKIVFKEVADLLPPGYVLNKTEPKPTGSSIDKILAKAKPVDLSALLPPGYKPTTEKPAVTSERPSTTAKPKANKILEKAKPVVDVSAFLPPGYKPTEKPKDVNGILSKAEPVDVSAFLPPGYKPTEKPKDVSNILNKAEPVDVSAFLPPGYKPPKDSGAKPSNNTKRKPNVPVHAADGALLPPGYKPQAAAKPVNISSLLPPGYKAPQNASSGGGLDKILDDAVVDDISAFLPPGYKPRFTTPKGKTLRTTTEESVPSTTAATGSSSTSSSGFKVVFPSRPGGGMRKPSGKRLTTPKPLNNDGPVVTAPSIQKGWPSRATTEFTGWPTPSTTPISIEKLLEAARTAKSSTTTLDPTITLTTAATTSTTTTTTPKPTTPGICDDDCDLVGTIKLVGGAKWVPELLDRNTKEYQILANEVQTQLENVYSKSNTLNKWYKQIKIDGFSKGSVLVDYLVELSDVGKRIDTLEIKRIFHESLEDAFARNTNREPKDLSDEKLDGKYSFGNFIVDPQYTDFVVIPKQTYPTVGYAEDDVLLPQWAIAVIVIGLASLLFVIIFGVTVLVNRQKNSKKKQPTALTEEMLNELNKNHMGGFDNYGADDLYNMEDVWNEKAYDTKLPKKKSTGSIHDNSTSNLYDSWRSEWNGYYYNAYYANNPGSAHGYPARRKSDYDTNF